MSEPIPAPKESVEFNKPLEVHETNIPGLVWYDIPVFPDARGAFSEKYNRQKMGELGLPDLGPIQQNVSSNEYSATRGIHAEPWDKFIAVMSGKVFGAWVDLREGDTFGEVFTLELDASKAIYVPRGVGNGFQAIGPDAYTDDGVKVASNVYGYLVNQHWSKEAKPLYTYVSLADPTVNIPWPIPLDQAILSDDDRTHPLIDDVVPMKPRKILVTGANGQLGRALRVELPDAEFVDHSDFDITDPSTWGERNWRQYQAIINAGAFTKVDQAETTEGRHEAWAANAEAPRAIAKIAIENHLTLVHVSTDYVYDGETEIHEESEPLSPLSVYGQSKAAGDVAVGTVPDHYLVRTSWVVGDGGNFVKTMRRVGKEDENPRPGVNDQFGRPTFAKDLAKAIKHLLDTEAPFGTYNVTNEGETTTWAELARQTFELSGLDPNRIQGVTTEEFFRGRSPVAPRPSQSTLNLAKIEATGFAPRPWPEALRDYIEELDQLES